MVRKQKKSWKKTLYEIIFEAETPAGKAFDVALLLFIVISVAAVILESVPEIKFVYGRPLVVLEWVLTITFTIEYALRILCVSKPKKYIFSFFGIIDLLAILPTYLSLIFVDTHYLIVIRAVRLLRVFRVFKMVRYVNEAKILLAALKSSQQKIVAFLGGVLSLVIIMGALMYMVEGNRNGFSSIPQSMYWAIVTLTTVGYGDVVPHTALGKFLAALVMILGYAIIAVPTGIVSAELVHAHKVSVSTRTCKKCTKMGHDPDSKHCRYCGAKLLVLLSFIFLFPSLVSAKNAPQLVKEVVAKAGGLKALKAKKDVEYHYVYRDNATGKEDVSIERYVFDGELSWARYTKREKHVLPDTPGTVLQGYDGKTSWMTVNGKHLTDPQALKLADFLRKTNFYWFAMMFKLTDPGVNHTYLGTKRVDGVNYDVVKVTFGENVGDVADIYHLYINPKTKFVDQFLFTVMDFGLKDPLLMRVTYENVEGLWLPAKRKYIESDWEATIKGQNWTDEIMTKIKFGNGFTKTLFAKP